MIELYLNVEFKTKQNKIRSTLNQNYSNKSLLKLANNLSTRCLGNIQFMAPFIQNQPVSRFAIQHQHQHKRYVFRVSVLNVMIMAKIWFITFFEAKIVKPDRSISYRMVCSFISISKKHLLSTKSCNQQAC